MPPLFIVGLGNPGVNYEHTRHNIGFDIVDALADNLGVEFSSVQRFDAKIAKVVPSNVFLIKPQTFMNLSGNAVALMTDFYKIEDLLVVHDDLDLSLGCLRFKKGGSSGGHNGLKSIDSKFGNEYYRLRFGIERSEKNRILQYVLERFDSSQIIDIPPLIVHCVKALKHFIENRDFFTLQNRFTLNPKTLLKVELENTSKD